MIVATFVTSFFARFAPSLKFETSIPRRTLSAVIDGIYWNPNALIMICDCAFGCLIPREPSRVRFFHVIESDGMKSTTLNGSILTPRLAAVIEFAEWIIEHIDATCSQCDPNGSH